MNFWKRYIGDYLRDTLDISLAEDGAYGRLLDWVYANECPVPHSERYRVTRAQGTAEKRAVDRALEKYFERTTDGWVSHRAAREIEKAGQKRTASRQNGKLGGRPPKPKTEPIDNPVGSDLETQLVSKSKPKRKAHQTPDTRHQREEPPNPPSGPDRFAESFKQRPQDRPDVMELHQAWCREFGRENTPLVVGWNTDDAQALADRIDASGLSDALLVAHYAKHDGMVSGLYDERGSKHESIRYIFGNNEAFSRILRDAKKRERERTTESPAAEIARLKGLG